MRSLALQILPLIAVLAAFTGRSALAADQEFGFAAPATAADAALPEAVRDLARRIVPVYQEDDTDRYLSNLAVLQLLAGDPAAAEATRRSLEDRRRSQQRGPFGRAVVYDVYVRARAIEAKEHVAFASAYAEAFRATLGEVGDLEAYELKDAFMAPVEPIRQALQRALDEQREKREIPLAEALDLVQAWFGFEVYSSVDGLVRPLLAQDDEMRYVIDDDVAIPIGGSRAKDAADATIAATLVRPRSGAVGARLPSVLEFTLDRAGSDPRASAAHGYVSVLALARIAGEPRFRPRAPFQSEGDDARAVIDWIAMQPWSDGRVAMQGTGYGGFVAWSAAKRLPEALKVIATSDPIAPGIDLPMTNGIFRNSAYRWLNELLAAQGDQRANEPADWGRFEQDWYRSGRSYREYPALPNRASAVFRSWLNHPSYDRYWQKWLPFGGELAQIHIPVLTITGYYSAGETASLYYFTQHHRYDADAEHALLIGPFDGQSLEGAGSTAVRGLTLDPVARLDPNDVRYEWIDHALKGGERPALLGENVNYEIAGADEWRHARSLDALENKPLRLYLAASPAGPPHLLVAGQPTAPMSLVETLDLRSRDDGDWRPSTELVLPALPARKGTSSFVAEPLAEAVDVAGRLRGVLDFTINKYDVDLVVMLYELRSNGVYVKLIEPAYAFRASYAGDRVHRRLLKAGVRQQLSFQSEKMVGRRIAAGSRLVLVLGINKRADQQINYGSTKDVSEASIEDAGAPIRIRWHEGTFIEVPSQ